MSIKVVMPSNLLILCRPLLLSPSVFPSIRVFSNESVLCIRWPKYWSFSFSISTSNEYSRMIPFRTDCLDLLVVQGTLKSLLQHHNLVSFSFPRRSSQPRDWNHISCIGRWILDCWAIREAHIYPYLCLYHIHIDDVIKLQFFCKEWIT